MGSPRLLVELCIGADSNLGADIGCYAVRVAVDQDLTSGGTVVALLGLMDLDVSLGMHVLVWGSLPCTSGCPLWNVLITRYLITLPQISKTRWIIQKCVKRVRNSF